MTIRPWTRTQHRRFTSPPPPVANPDPSWTKDLIVAWLAGRGVSLDKKALAQLSKAELLSMAADLLDQEA
jgi:hypothetical protein